MRYYFSHDHASCLFFRQFAQVPHLVPRRPRTVDDIERKKFGKLRHTMKFKICTGSYVWRFGILIFIGGPATTFFGWGGIKKAELRIVRVRVPPSDGTEARGGSLGRARMCVCVCGTLACDLEYEVCSGRRLLRMLGFCLRIVTYLWEITRIPLE